MAASKKKKPRHPELSSPTGKGGKLHKAIHPERSREMNEPKGANSPGKRKSSTGKLGMADTGRGMKGSGKHFAAKARAQFGPSKPIGNDKNPKSNAKDKPVRNRSEKNPAPKRPRRKKQ